jgi:hypothetical protein
MKLFKVVKEIRSRKGVLHFKRWVIFGNSKFEIYLHYFSKADEDFHLHDHPWNFFSFILYGGYVEKTEKGFNEKKPFSFSINKAEHKHKIVKLLKKKCISIVIAGPRIREWGYQTEDGWMNNIDYRKWKKNRKN